MRLVRRSPQSSSASFGPRLLFVSNGHGEASIAARIASELRSFISNTELQIDHLPLVGTGAGSESTVFSAVIGPRMSLPSGGLVAMGNLPALTADLRAGLIGQIIAQIRTLRTRPYELRVAVGDVYVLALTLLGGGRPVFVGTAKSVYVASYGPGERMLLRRAAHIFVRDNATAISLRKAGVPAESPGNVIADLATHRRFTHEEKWLALLPGSRPSAYADTIRLARVLGELAARGRTIPAFLSVAPALDSAIFAADLARDGWTVENGDALTPFRARRGSAYIEASREPIGSLIAASGLAIGQAGTANEVAAAAGVPVVALEHSGERETWYRMRQRRLLGNALLVLSDEPHDAAAAIDALLEDETRMEAMAAAGRERMGNPGGARAIAGVLAAALSSGESARE